MSSKYNITASGETKTYYDKNSNTMYKREKTDFVWEGQNLAAENKSGEVS